jgi:hypothetical protein
MPVSAVFCIDNVVSDCYITITLDIYHGYGGRFYWDYSYAHPWEFEKWDGETPFSVPAAVANVDNSSKPPGPTQSSANEVTMQSRREDDSGDMEIDDRQTQPSIPLESALIQRPETSTKQTKPPTYIPPSQDPSSSPSLSLQREAVEQFLT